MSESPKKPKTAKEIARETHRKLLKAFPNEIIKDFDNPEAKKQLPFLIKAMEEYKTQERTRILGLIEYDIKFWSAYGSPEKIEALKDLKTRIQEGE